jgi:hypothetical protein
VISTIKIIFIFTDAPYKITFNKSGSLSVVAGRDSITVACNAICSPSCSYKWQKIDGFVVRNSKTLHLDPVHQVDHGSYVCVASNKHITGGLRKQFTLIVNCKYVLLKLKVQEKTL